MFRNTPYRDNERFRAESVDVVDVGEQIKGYSLTLDFREAQKRPPKRVWVCNTSKRALLNQCIPEKVNLDTIYHCSVYIKQYAVYVNVQLFGVDVNRSARFDDA